MIDVETRNSDLDEGSNFDPNLVSDAEFDDIGDDALIEAVEKVEKLPPESELTADEVEYLEYINHDPVKKWQWTNDEDIFMVDMCPENRVELDIPKTSDRLHDQLPENNGELPSDPVPPNSQNHNQNHEDQNIVDQSVNVAPGEGQIPVNPLREKDWDVKAHPNIYPDGKNGLHHDRPIKLTTTQFTNQKVLNKNTTFSSDKTAVYGHATLIEREQLQRNCNNLSYNRGKVKTDASGTKCYSLEDPFAVLDKISNTPKFWSNYRSEVIAKLKNKGPFQLFFTLSCAEKRWMENLAHILRKKYGDLNITFKYVDADEIDDSEDVNELLKEFDVEMDINEFEDISDDLNNLFDDPFFDRDQNEANLNENLVQSSEPSNVKSQDDPSVANCEDNSLSDIDKHSTASVIDNAADDSLPDIDKHNTVSVIDNAADDSLPDINKHSTASVIDNAADNSLPDIIKHSTVSVEQSVPNECIDPINNHPLPQSQNDVTNRNEQEKANQDDPTTNSNGDKNATEEERQPRVSLLIDNIPWKEYMKKNNLHLNLHEEMKNSVLMLTRNFDHRLKMFTKFIIMSKSGPMHSKYYTYRIEFQARGAGHAHGLLWLDLDAVERDSNGKIIRDPVTNQATLIFPGVKEAERKIKNELKLDENDIQSLVQFADKFVSVSLSDPDICDVVMEVNTHHHTRTCRKYSPDQCRFGFPRFPTNKTTIAVPYHFMEGFNENGEPLSPEEKKEIFDDLSEVLDLVKATLKDDKLMAEIDVFSPEDQIEALCKISGVTVKDYEEALKYTFCSYKIHHKRAVAERMVNNYNKEWLLAWNGNMDIQVCLDFYAIITYISDYVTKDETGVTKALKEALDKVENLSYIEKLYKLADVFCTHRSMGEAEVYYRIISSLHLTESNLACVFLPTGFPENRSKFLRFVPEEEVGRYAEGQLVTCEHKEGHYLANPSVIEKYMRRPVALENMCLMQFVKVYDGMPASQVPKGVKFLNGVSVVTDHKKELSEAENEKLTKGRKPGEHIVANESEDLEFHLNRYRDFDKIIVTHENDSSMTVEQYRKLLLPKYIEISDPLPGEIQFMRLRKEPKAVRTFNHSKYKQRNEYHYSELLQYRPFRSEDELFENDEKACAELYQERVLQVNHEDDEVHDQGDGQEHGDLYEAETSIEMSPKVNDISGIFNTSLDSLGTSSKSQGVPLLHDFDDINDADKSFEMNPPEVNDISIILNISHDTSLDTSDDILNQFDQIDNAANNSLPDIDPLSTVSVIDDAADNSLPDMDNHSTVSDIDNAADNSLPDMDKHSTVSVIDNAADKSLSHIDTHSRVSVEQCVPNELNDQVNNHPTPQSQNDVTNSNEQEITSKNDDEIVVQTKVNRVKSIVMEHLEGVEEGKVRAEEILNDKVGAALDPEHEQEVAEGENEGMQEHPDYPIFDAPDIDIERRHYDKLYREIDLKPEDDLYADTRNLDEEQMMVLEECVQFAKQLKKFRSNGRNYPQEIPKIMVQGGAGAGKSTVINTIIQWMERILRTEGDNPDHPYIIAAAPTGAAASHIDGNTMHSSFSFSYSNKYIPLGNKQKHLKKTVLQNLRVIIIDEISMVKADQLYQLHLRLSEITGEENEPFGGVAVFCFGDLLQLRPVQAHYVFEEPDHYPLGWKLGNLWRKFKSIKLVKNHRQGADGRYADLLNRARYGELNDEDIEMLESRVRPEGHPDIMGDAQFVCATNAEVEKVNNERLAKLNTEEHVENAVNLCATRRHYKPLISTNGFVGSTQFKNVLKLKVGARIMITNNIDVHDGLTNGAIGEVLGFRKNNDRVKEVIVKLNNPKAGRKRRNNPEYSDLLETYGADNRPTPIGRQDFEYSIKKTGGKTAEAYKARVIQFPLRLAFAATAHKFQGQTVCQPLKLVIDMRSTLQKAQAYVMLSRVQSLDQIFILQKLHAQKIAPSPEAVVELNTLDQNAVENWSKPADKTVITWQNTRSLVKHHADMKLSRRHRFSDVLSCSETWFDAHDNELDYGIDELGSPTVVKAGHGKGLAIYSSKSLDQFEMVKESNYQIAKFLYGGEYNIISVYRSSSANCSKVLSDILKLCDEDKLTVIGGDFNICALKEPDNALIKGLENARFRQLVSEATHIKGRVIDHCYVREPLDCEMTPLTPEDVTVRSVYWSDHDAVMLNLPKV